MSSVLLDTHALVWYLEKSPRLSASARAAVKACIQAGQSVYVSSITLAEVLYLDEKGRLAAGTFRRVLGEMTAVDSVFVEAPFTVAVADRMTEIPRNQVPDFPDRMIAATSLFLGVPFVTADDRVHRTGIPTIW
jgi:PIN domain nuclease of toxin-antitoxin system